MKSDGPVIGLATSFTADRIHAALSERWLTREADFNQLYAVCLDPIAALGGEVDRLVLLWRIEDVFEQQLLNWRFGIEGAERILGDAVDELVDLATAVAHRHGVSVVLGTPPHPSGLGFDDADPRWSLPIGQLVAAARFRLIEAAADNPSLTVIDHGRLVDRFGADQAHDPRNQLLYRQPYSSDFAKSLAAEVVRSVERLDTPPPKAVVVDADNTLWGGIVGEDGVAGIAIGDTFPGSAFRHFQSVLRSLRHDGVLIGVASKNEPDAVAEVFAERPEMVLGSDDVAAWRVGWGPKSESVREIAAEFNIGLDAVVFVDDSPFEIEEVRAKLPEVQCLLVPEDVEELPDLLAATGLFRGIAASDEDRHRTAMMQTEGSRRVAAETMSHDDFLASLDLRVSIRRDNPFDLARVTQLINKTNQFNLTTIRRTEAEVAALLESDEHTVYAGDVEDRFGSYGLVVVAIVDWTEGVGLIDSLLMSCRVLRRGIETAMLAMIGYDAASRGVALRGEYRPTRKNLQVADLYPDHGFDLCGGHDDALLFELTEPMQLSTPPHVTLDAG